MENLAQKWSFRKLLSSQKIGKFANFDVFLRQIVGERAKNFQTQQKD
jgi:hypothetical protein